MTMLELFECDGPECEERKPPRDAHGWLAVQTLVHPEGEKLESRAGTFCSSTCLEEWASDLETEGPIPASGAAEEEVLHLPPTRLGQYM